MTICNCDVRGQGISLVDEAEGCFLGVQGTLYWAHPACIGSEQG